MTVTIETPTGLKSGSAVRQVNWGKRPPLLEVSSFYASAKGEAVVVDMGKDGIIFSPLNNYSPDYAHQVGFLTPGWREAGWFSRFFDGEYPEYVLTPKDYPLLVTFKDLNDPASITLVMQRGPMEQPDKIIDNFETLFGKGFKLYSVTLKLTHEPVTYEVGNLLAWLPDYYDRLLDGEEIMTSESKNRFANNFASGSFSTKKQ